MCVCACVLEVADGVLVCLGGLDVCVCVCVCVFWLVSVKVPREGHFHIGDQIKGIEKVGHV